MFQAKTSIGTFPSVFLLPADLSSERSCVFLRAKLEIQTGATSFDKRLLSKFDLCVRLWMDVTFTQLNKQVKKEPTDLLII